MSQLPACDWTHTAGVISGFSTQIINKNIPNFKGWNDVISRHSRLNFGNSAPVLPGLFNFYYFCKVGSVSVLILNPNPTSEALCTCTRTDDYCFLCLGCCNVSAAFAWSGHSINNSDMMGVKDKTCLWFLSQYEALPVIHSMLQLWPEWTGSKRKGRTWKMCLNIMWDRLIECKTQECHVIPCKHAFFTPAFFTPDNVSRIIISLCFCVV